jgi:hypothetical protein
MARNFTIAALITKGRRRCGQETRDLLSAAEWQDELSTICSEFQGLIVDSGSRIFETELEITATGASGYALPANFLAEVGVDRVIGSNREHLTPLLVQERNHTQSVSGDARYYALVNDEIRFFPNPASGTYYLIYAPQCPDYTVITDSTEIDVITPAGENYFSWSLALVGGIKEESELTPYYEKQVDKYRRQIEKWANQRMLTAPVRRYVEYGEPGSLYPGEWNDWSTRS